MRTIAGVVVTARGDLPSGCRPDQIASSIRDFFAAVNKGRPATRFFAREGGSDDLKVDAADGMFSFRWYSAAGRGGRIVTAYTHGALLAFSARRHGQGERLRLLVLDVHREQPFAVGALYVVARTAGETVPAGERLYAHGKAGFNCPGRSIFVWSMTGGMPSRGAGAPTALSSSAPPTPTR